MQSNKLHTIQQCHYHSVATIIAISVRDSRDQFDWTEWR